MVKNLTAKAGDAEGVGLIPGLGRSLRGGNGNPLLVFLLGKSHGQRSLVDYSPWVPKSWTALNTHTHIHIGMGKQPIDSWAD